MGAPAAAEMKMKEGMEAAEVARARVIAFPIVISGMYDRRFSHMGVGHTSISIHQLIRQLPITFTGLQFPFLQRIHSTPDLGAAERSS